VKKSIETLIDEALQNIRDDREIARELLNDTANILATSPSETKNLGPIAAKHVETLQRSNEQLVKLISIRQKEQNQSLILNNNDKAEIFDLINNFSEEESLDVVEK